MSKKEVALLEGRLLSIQSKQFKKVSKSFDRLENWPSKSHFVGHVNRLIKHKVLA